jgi:predicted membrane channel-forming protein YqfA (hemolysin III family)
MKRKVGVALVVAAYALLLYTSLAAPAYARAHPHMDKAMLAEYAGPWPVALASALAVVGIMLALIPIRRGERWALWTSLATLIVLLVTRIFTDPRCLVVLDPHQHGCHTFMIALVLGILGVVLVAFSRSPHQAG